MKNTKAHIMETIERVSKNISFPTDLELNDDDLVLEDFDARHNSNYFKGYQIARGNLDLECKMEAFEKEYEGNPFPLTSVMGEYKVIVFLILENGGSGEIVAEKIFFKAY